MTYGTCCPKNCFLDSRNFNKLISWIVSKPFLKKGMLLKSFCKYQYFSTWSQVAHCYSAPSCPVTEQIQEWWPNHLVQELVHGSGSADLLRNSCWGSWQKNGDEIEYDCEVVEEVVSELTGCDGLKALERKKTKRKYLWIIQSFKKLILNL